MWELDYKESWTLNNWCFWSVVVEKTLESPLDSKEIQPVHAKGNQSWIFIRRTDAEAETLILGHLMQRTDWLEKTLMLGILKVGREGNNRGWDGWMTSPTPRVYPNSSPSSRWCHPTISSSVVPFSSCLQSFPASVSFQMIQLFTSGCQSTEVSASTSVLKMSIHDWFPLGWTGWISLKSKGLSRVFSTTTVQKNQFFSAQLSL